MAATTAGAWGLAELATPPGVGWATVDLGSLGRTVGLIAAAAVGVPAAVLAYHRQRALDTANHVAALQHEHKVTTDGVEHNTGVERHLRERYTTCAEQLGNEKSSAIRLAGVYALISLSDDWHRFGNDSERQVCIDLLCAYLRTKRQPDIDAPLPKEENRYSNDYSGEEHQVRTAIINAIRTRTESRDSQWTNCKFDLSGADLTNADLSGSDLSGADLVETRLFGAILDRANLFDARLYGANLTGAMLTNATLSRAGLWRADLASTDLAGADLSRVDLSATNLEKCRYSDRTKWPDGFKVPPSAVNEDSQEEPDPDPV